MPLQVIRTINRGGFGVVEQVRLDNGSIRARKRFSPAPHLHAGGDDLAKLVLRFHREVRIQSALPPSIVCPIIDSNLNDVEPWYIMPLADETLEQFIFAHRREPRECVQPLADVLNALEELHQLGYVHRDLKPQNVLRLGRSWVLADFGLVLPPRGETSTLTGTASSWGTELYMAPEQYDGFHTVDHRADIYAFGCILHDIFGTGPRVPFAQHSADGPIGWIIERCTAQRHSKRFATIQALRGALMPHLISADFDVPSEEAHDWTESLANGTISDEAALSKFVRYLANEATAEDHWTILRTLDESHLRWLHGIDEALWNELAGIYCDWVTDAVFGFEFCDVLIGRIETIYELGTVSTKSGAVLCAARLASSHNRWFVMRRVLRLCGVEMDDAVAARVCIDIQAFGRARDFVACAEMINLQVKFYHPSIAILLADH